MGRSSLFLNYVLIPDPPCSLNKIGFDSNDLLSSYDSLLILGHWNSEVSQKGMRDFCVMYELDNLIKDPTYFKSAEICLPLT